MTASGETLPGLKLKAPPVESADIERLLKILRGVAGWLTAREICEVLYGRWTDALDRRVRAIASAARPAVVSFPGSPGYNLWERCTVEEILHGIEAMEAQGQDMIKQANVYRVAYYRRFRGAKAEEKTAELFTHQGLS